MGGLALAIGRRGGFRVEHPYTHPSPLAAAESGSSVLIDQAVQMLGVSRRTVYYWIRQGRLRTVRTRLGSQRVLVTSIRDLASAPAATPPPSRAVPAGALGGFTS
jgi:excisionase family DNA binding protein